VNYDHFLTTAWRALLQHKLRSILSSLGIVIAIMSVLAALAIGEGAKREALEQLEQLGTNNLIVRPIAAEALPGVSSGAGGRSLPFGAADSEHLLRAIPGAVTAASLSEVQLTVTHAAAQNLPLSIHGVSGSYFSAKGLMQREGRLFSDLDFQRKNAVCVLGADAARQLGAQGKSGATLIIGNQPFRVVGVLRERDWSKGKVPALTGRNYNMSVFVPLGIAQTATAPGAVASSAVDEISLLMKPGSELSDAALLARRILSANHRSAADFQIIVPEELIQQSQRTQRLFNLMLLSIALISLLVGSIGIFNIMLSSVVERTHEIGIRRSVGASQKHIARHFLSEAVLLTLIGGVVGVLLGYLLSAVVGALVGWKVTVTLVSVLVSLIISVSVGVFAGIVPALRAARMNPVAAIRSE
jgi:putative ABC transport system permease protein